MEGIGNRLLSGYGRGVLVSLYRKLHVKDIRP